MPVSRLAGALFTALLICTAGYARAAPNKVAPAAKGEAPQVASVAPASASGFLAFPDFSRRVKGDVGDSLEWNPRWPKFGLTGWLVGGSFGATAAVMALIGPIGNRWKDRLGVDESVRDVLRAHSEHARRTMRDVSDVLLTTTVSYSLVDAVLVAGWFRRSPEVAKQMALINLEVFGVTQGVLSLIKSFASRERPYGRICGAGRPDNSRDCESSDRFYSFASGHAGQSFAAAAANCTHHAYLGLYGSRGADALSCAAGFTMAAGTGLMRLAGDQHYLTDVLAGAAVGTLVGFGVPWFFHYRHGHSTKPAPKNGPSVRLLPLPFGAMAVGSF